MEAAVVGAVVGALVNNIAVKVVAVIAKRSSELGTLAGDIESLKTELELIASTIDAEQKGQPIAHLQQIPMTRMRDLAFDVEDCLDQFLPCAACGGGVPILDVMSFRTQVTDLKRRLTEAYKQIDGANARQQASRINGQSVGTQAVPTSEASDMVGIEKPKQEILGLLDCEKLMVISIVGFGGSGKTALARAVFDCDEARQKFGLHAWYAASEHKDGDELLVAIVKHLHPQETLTAAQIRDKVSWLHGCIRDRLQNTSCLIVIDDLEEKDKLEAIKTFLSKLPMIRILVTTAVNTVARACTGDSDYIYNMTTLSVEDSKDLLKKKVVKFNSTSLDLANGSAAIVQKCHGHPLSLISVANYLLNQSKHITGQVCQATTKHFCTHVDADTNKDFTKLHQLLVNNYSRLSGKLKTCLLYTSLFPTGCPISRKTLTRRWIAEGYIKHENERTAQETADDMLEQLMDRNIIRPVDTSNSGEKKTCKPHGIMHQFMLYKSISSKFIAPSLQDRGNYRHIIMDNHKNRSVDHGIISAAGRRNLLSKLVCSCFKPSIGTEEAETKCLRPRSLTVLGRAEKAVYSDLVNCELLKVLDLKECNNLVDEHIEKIYKLLHLKYLTLGSSVMELSDKMENLHCLETLDLRKTKIEILPVEVISLPHLLHLFGMIKINKFSSSKLNNFKCNLETLSGVVVERESQFPELMVHMKQLKKLKIWCRTTSKDRNYKILLDAIREFAQADMDTLLSVRSLYLDLHDSSKNLLGDLMKNAQAATGTPEGNHSLSLHLNDSSEDSCPPILFVLRSLKLNGRPTLFCDFATSMAGLEELCLTYTNLKGADLLAGLRELKCLVYLKLVEVHLEDLNINYEDALPSLNRLCIVVKQSKFPTIAQGALQNLVSLQLLCKDLVGLCDGIKVKYFKDLEEVALDSRVHKGNTIVWWENEAKVHPKMPKVVLLKRVESASQGKYVATDHGCLEPLV